MAHEPDDRALVVFADADEGTVHRQDPDEPLDDNVPACAAKAAGKGWSRKRWQNFDGAEDALHGGRVCGAAACFGE